MSHASSLETKEQILDVAEDAIAQHGYAGTTLRKVVSQAGVNLAAVHYHFGSKEDLFRAVIRRISQPIVSTQLQDLEALLSQSNEPPSVEAIL
ncbi:MAG: helix-turn-helix domain-containing protein, partial [Cyanobacteria bacterium J06649_4]